MSLVKDSQKDVSSPSASKKGGGLTSVFGGDSELCIYLDVVLSGLGTMFLEPLFLPSIGTFPLDNAFKTGHERF